MVNKENDLSNVYDEIAESWYRLRHWTRFRAELDEVAQRWGSGKLLNVGCAHGPDFLPFKDKFDLWGLDSSSPMISLALKYSDKFKFKASLLVADAVSLPFQDKSFDWIISVAAYHHILDKQSRLQAFRELRRVLKPGGEVFLTVWNRWQKDFIGKGKEVIVPWNIQNKQLMRYYYLFTYPEITKLLKSAGLAVMRSYPESNYRFPVKYFSRNICILARPD
jgi:ubiquinone/menaquinone biosynthesis C-methylase UbiE